MKKHQKAIICVMDSSRYNSRFSRILTKQLMETYIVKLVNQPEKVELTINIFEKKGIEVVLVVVDYRVNDVKGLDIISNINKWHSEIITMLFVDDLGQDRQLAHLVRDGIREYELTKEKETLMKKLFISEEEKSLILESISESIIFMDLNKKILWENSVATKELKVWRASSKTFEQYFFCSKITWSQLSMQLNRERKSFSIESIIEDGKSKLIRVFPAFDEDNNLVGVVFTMLDITERVVAENMTESLLEMSKSINAANSIVAIYSKAYEYLCMYFKLKHMCVAGIDYDNSYIEFMSDAKEKLDKSKVLHILIEVQKLIHKNHDDDFFLFENEVGTVIAYPMNQKVLMFILDQSLLSGSTSFKFINTIAEQIKMGMNTIENLRKMTYQAKHDSNTGLYNREYFINRLKGHMMTVRHREHKNHSIAIIDLNYFKDVNDNFGHIVGDQVILETAERLKKAIRNTDVVARVGGDEFAILFVNQSRSEVVYLIKRLQEEISKPIIQNDYDIVVGSSIGIVYNIERYTDISTLLRDADKAMYEAKKDKSGIGTYMFYEKAIQKKVERHCIIEEAMRGADLSQHLGMLFQPIVQLSDMNVVGYEGFLRWYCDDGNNYLPNDFIPIASESEEIIEIGRHVLRLAIEAVHKMDVAGYSDTFINVNLTVKELMSDNYVTLVKKRIVDDHIASNRLRLDVVDRFRENQLCEAAKNIRELDDFGILMSLDDYGKDRDSLAILHELDFREIKIDSSYINSIRHDAKTLKMVKSIISFAKTLGLQVSAEGVERKEELRILRNLECDKAQGYLFAKPLPIDQAIRIRHIDNL